MIFNLYKKSQIGQSIREDLKIEGDPVNLVLEPYSYIKYFGEVYIINRAIIGIQAFGQKAFTLHESEEITLMDVQIGRIYGNEYLDLDIEDSEGNKQRINIETIKTKVEAPSSEEIQSFEEMKEQLDSIDI